jgi:TonB family protein
MKRIFAIVAVFSATFICLASAGPPTDASPTDMGGASDGGVRGTLDKEIIRRVIGKVQNIGGVRFCYDRGLAQKPELQGRVIVRFTIAPSGEVIDSVVASSTLGDPSTEQCIADKVLSFEFPKPAGGGKVVVSYPFNLRPAR